MYRRVASAKRTPLFSSTNVQSVRWGRDVGVASIDLSADSGTPRDAKNASTTARASACDSLSPAASSLMTERNPISSPSGENAARSSSCTPERNQRIRHCQILASRP